MTQNIKNILGIAAALAVLALGYAALSYVNAYSKVIEPSSFRSFSVSGDGKATGIPDIATFSFQVITEGGTDVAAIQTQNTAATNKVIAFVKAQGVADKDIQTEYYNVDPRYQTYNCVTPPIPYDMTSGGGAVSGASPASIVKPCPPASIAGYTVTQSVNVKMRDFSKIGDIMGGVVTNGANQVGSLSFTIDDPTQVSNQARAQAIAHAQAEAQAIAAAGNFKIGRLLTIQDGNPSPIYNYSPVSTDMKALAVPAAATPTIQAGSQEMDVTVTMQYEIE
jgi:uncharacterized protein YggE